MQYITAYSIAVLYILKIFSFHDCYDTVTTTKMKMQANDLLKPIYLYHVDIIAVITVIRHSNL